MAMSLTEARKGLLLARTDEDGDGDLDLVAHQGFDGDPTHSVLAQRFGRQVLEQDRMVHEDAAASTPEGDDTAADREFENLVAIPIYIADRFSGVVVCANRPGGFEGVEDEVLLALGDHAGAVLENARLHDQLRGSYLSTVKMLAEAVQAKDPFLRGHSEAVSGHVAAVAARLGLGDRRREELVFASLLHDVGKIGISERILHKPAALTPEEFAIIRLHPRIGYRLVEQVPSLRAVAPSILHHHERFDGAGYPAGLSGEQIPLEARIVGVADAFSAMTSDRPYRTRMTHEQAFAELERNSGTQFDPEIVRVFVDEVRARPGAAGEALAAALDDAELQLHRAPDEPVLGAGALALTDSLTLLYTHRYLHDAVAAEAERCRAAGPPATFSVVLVQLDEVPHINGTQGFAAGDGHLRAAARVLTRLAVRNGATACRENGIVLALLTPVGHDVDADVLVLEAREALRDFGAVRVGGGRWQEGDDGEAVITRARGGLAVAPLGVDGTA
jgi:HD-GYP domain-containing protein (c-di-GMP phosphodiesterase class II)